MSLRRFPGPVFVWSRFQPERGYDFNGTALPSPDGTVLLVDPVSPTDAELDELRALGSRFVVVLLTADHERAAAHVSKVLEAPVFAPEADLAAVKLPGAQPFAESHVFPGGWVAHHLASLKTPGETALFHPGRRALVVGDAVIADPVTGLRLVPPAKIANRAAAFASLRRLAALDFDALFVGDGFSLPSGGKAALESFLAREPG
jgi:glyoxylase-like metal-dependent hydrolase (beta-lactamase superfamily II)